MMSLAAQQLKAEWEAEAKAQAKAEAKAEAKVKTKAEVLLRLLRRRFGDLAPTIEARVQVADSEQLDIWMDRLMDRRPLSEIFPADPSR